MTVVKKALLADVVKIIGGGTRSRAKPEYYNGSIQGESSVKRKTSLNLASSLNQSRIASASRLA